VPQQWKACLLFGCVAWQCVGLLCASDFDTIGVTQLRAFRSGLFGAGVRVAQPEAGDPNWQVNPSAVGQPVSLFTFISSAGAATSFPNALGSESAHANEVASRFYGASTGVAPEVQHVDNYEAGHFFQDIVSLQAAIPASVINQSFVFSDASPGLQQTAVDSAYDNYAARFNVLFVSGAGNGGAVGAPATAYNGLGVAAFGGSSSVGPTPDNGRSKPDITAPATLTSFSTPLVAGAAALLVQAALRGDGGAGVTNAAVDIRIIKALLLNGAVKPSNWTHTVSAPLDTRYGTGVLNVFNSYLQLTGGQQAPTDSSTVSAGAAHPPTSATGSVASMRGWNFGTIVSSVVQDAVQHYLFDLPGRSNDAFIAAVTLVWNRQLNQSGINDLDLFLYDTRDNSLLASSQSAVDNVEHLFVSGLKPGRYDLQVLKNGGLAKRVTNDETYALAFDFTPVMLDVAQSVNGVTISWPGSALGFELQSAPAFGPSSGWTSVTNSVAWSGGQSSVIVSAGSGGQFFRLSKP
jgi:hypothetical protein